MASTHSLLAQLALSIANNAKLVDAYVHDNGLPEPGFDINAPVDYAALFADPVVRAAQVSLANDAKKLHLLMAGHAEMLKTQGMRENNKQGALHLLCHFNVAENVPLDGSISFAELSSKTGLNQDILTRAVRLAATEYVFCEKEPGLVSHTARSKILALEPGQRASIEFGVTESMPSVARYVDSVSTLTDKKITPFELAFGMPFFEHKKSNPTKNAMFAKVMAGNKKQNRGQEIADAYDWARFTDLLVDVGGGIGHVTTCLAKVTPNVKFVIQDLPDLQAQADAYIASEELSSRVSFIGHDFFQPQPQQTQNASAYFLCHVLHDWPDAKCLEILRPVIAAMGATSRLVICESILPKPGQLTEEQEYTIRAQDLGMFGYFHARERSLDDLTSLVQSVEPALKVFKVIGPPKTARNSIVEFARE